MNQLRKCSGPCGRQLPWTSEYFRRMAKSPSGFAYRCRDCSNAGMKKYWKENGKIQNARHTKRRQTRKTAGLCECCNKPRIQYSTRYCLDHWFKKISLANLGTKKYWKELKSLAEINKYQCVYTGDNLIPGFNISLDHINPKSKNPLGKYDVSNVQWVTTNINKAKSDLSHAEFLSMCERVHLNFERVPLHTTESVVLQ